MYEKKDLGVFSVSIYIYSMSEKNPKNNYGKKKVEYYCKKCDFLSSNKKDYTRHLKTTKHSRARKTPKKQPSVDFICYYCNKKYKHQSSWCRHLIHCENIYKCNVDSESENAKIVSMHAKQKNPKIENLEKFQQNIEKKVDNEDELSLKEILMTQLKQQNETIELLKQSIETNSKMSKNVGNNNNNTISINLFLNEQCKNAMNLTDFINQVQVSLEDLQFSKNNGYVEGVTNIFAKQLKDLKPTERPIHCSDKKRLQFYVKDDDKWTKDSNNEKIDNTIYNIKMKQTRQLTAWEKLHPNYVNDPELLNEWQQMLNNMTEDVTQPTKMKDKLKRNIAEYIHIKEALSDSNKKK